MAYIEDMRVKMNVWELTKDGYKFEELKRTVQSGSYEDVRRVCDLMRHGYPGPIQERDELIEACNKRFDDILGTQLYSYFETTMNHLWAFNRAEYPSLPAVDEMYARRYELFGSSLPDAFLRKSFLSAFAIYFFCRVDILSRNNRGLPSSDFAMMSRILRGSVDEDLVVNDATLHDGMGSYEVEQLPDNEKWPIIFVRETHCARFMKLMMSVALDDHKGAFKIMETYRAEKEKAKNKEEEEAVEEKEAPAP